MRPTAGRCCGWQTAIPTCRPSTTRSAAEADTTRPSLIIVHTTIGYGSPHKQGTSEAHGSPLGVEEVALTKQALGWKPQRSFHVPEQALTHLRTAIERGRHAHRAWERRLEAYARAYPDLAREWSETVAGVLPEGWDRDLPSWGGADALATRQASGKVLNVLAQRVPSLLAVTPISLYRPARPSTTRVPSTAKAVPGRNIHFGVRQPHGGDRQRLAYHGGVRPFVATFLLFCGLTCVPGPCALAA